MRQSLKYILNILFHDPFNQNLNNPNYIIFQIYCDAEISEERSHQGNL